MERSPVLPTTGAAVALKSNVRDYVLPARSGASRLVHCGKGEKRGECRRSLRLMLDPVTGPLDERLYRAATEFLKLAFKKAREDGIIPRRSPRNRWERHDGPWPPYYACWDIARGDISEPLTAVLREVYPARFDVRPSIGYAGRTDTIQLYESGPAVKLGTLFWFGPGASRTLG